MFKFFTVSSTISRLSLLDNLVRQYKTTKHSSTKMTAGAASLKEHEAMVYCNIYGYLPLIQTSRFRVGDKVRINKKNGTFEKGYTPRWTEKS